MIRAIKIIHKIENKLKMLQNISYLFHEGREQKNLRHEADLSNNKKAHF